nr:AAA family ATPase [Ardenticatenales bacterium]
MNPALLAYLPMDRRHALAAGTALPEHMQGAALFADISGFTPLTEALTRDLGPRRGAEGLAYHLNRVYDVLTSQVHQHRGSVIGFAGDAMTCWFDGDPGLRATACALAMQQAILSLPSEEIAVLSIKVAVVSGRVRRFLVGDPAIQVWEVLAGQTLTWLAEAEQLARKDEVLLDATTAARLNEAVQLGEWRTSSKGARATVVAGLTREVTPRSWPALAPDALTEAQVCSWLLPTVYERLRTGQGEFLTELRPAVALFLCFEGLDYEQDAQVGQKLNGFICWVQEVITPYEGSLLQLTVGDKGNYLYTAFGAPIAHEDDAARAVDAALQLRHPPAEFGIHTVKIGISRGTMRTGAYGGSQARTYGSLGDEVNLAARLMQHAVPGQVLASGRVQRATQEHFHWQSLPAVQVKGKAEPIPLFALLGARPQPTIHLQEPSYTLPIVGREGELAQIEACMERTLSGQGQVVGITGEAGMGKSRLVAEVVRRARARGLDGYGGECQSYGLNSPYLVWQPIWRSLFNLDASASLTEQEALLSQALEAIDPTLLPRLPLLGPVLGLPLADNDLTRQLDAKLRKGSREALLVDVLRAKAEIAARRGRALLLVLEDTHWLDPLSHDLLEVIGHASLTMPLLLLLAYRPPEVARLQAPHVARLPHFSEIRLGMLPAPEMTQLLENKLVQLFPPAGRPAPTRLVEQLLVRAEGLPFYAEELLNYLHDQALDPWDSQVLEQLELPSSLHSLVLSRIDQLTESQKVAIKVASVIGRVFSFHWLLGYYPNLGTRAQVHTDLEELRRLDLTPLEQPEPELTYLFKHSVTQEVSYESLPYQRRAVLHEQLATYLEALEGETGLPQLELLAYHYGRSENLSQRRRYLHLAGEAAQAAFANEAAVDYYERLLPLVAEAEQGEILFRLGEIFRVTGRYDDSERCCQQALGLSRQQADPVAVVRCQRALAHLYEQRGNYPEAMTWLKQAEKGSQPPELAGERSKLLSLKGHILARMGNYDQSLEMTTEALRLAEAQQDRRLIIEASINMANTYTDRGS